MHQSWLFLKFVTFCTENGNKVWLISDCNNLFGILRTQLIEYFHLLKTATLQLTGWIVKKIG